MRGAPAEIFSSSPSSTNSLWNWVSSFFFKGVQDEDIYESVRITRFAENWSSPQNPNLKYKVAKCVTLGSSFVGKTSLCHRIVRNQYDPYVNCTIGSSFMAKEFTVLNEKIKLEFWDTAGQERFNSLTLMYYRGASIILAVYDITNKESLEGAKHWIQEAKKQEKSMHPDHVVVLLGNKDDLAEYERQVPIEEAKMYANSNGYIHWEVSAKTGHNVLEAVLVAAERWLIGRAFRSRSKIDVQYI